MGPTRSTAQDAPIVARSRSLDEKASRTPYMSFGDRVRLQARREDGRAAPFGIIDQRLARS